MKTKTTALLLCLALAGSVSGRLTEESVRRFLEQRDSVIVANDADAILALFATNAALSVSDSALEGMDYSISLVHYMDLFSDSSKQEHISYKTIPKQITVADNGQEAEIETEALRTTCSVTGKRILHSVDRESIRITLVDGIPKIRALKQTRTKKTLVEDELAKRIMALVESGEPVTRDQAIELLEEMGGQLREREIDNQRLVTVRSPHFDPFGNEFPAIGSCIPDITKLSLGTRSCITDDGLRYIARMKNLQGLELLGAGITDTGIAQLTGLKNLKQLMLMDTSCTDAGLKHISRIHTLDNLFLGGNYTDEGLVHLADLPNLKQLMLFSPWISDETIHILSNMEQLEMLSISSAPVTDAALEHLTKLKNLKMLRLYESEVTYPAITRFQKEHPEINVGPEALVDPCQDSRRRIDYAKRRWAKKTKAPHGARPSEADLVPYIFSDGFFDGPLPTSIDALRCQGEGVFSINSIGQSASCSIHGAERRPRTARQNRKETR